MRWLVILLISPEAQDWALNNRYSNVLKTAANSISVNNFIILNNLNFIFNYRTKGQSHLLKRLTKQKRFR